MNKSYQSYRAKTLNTDGHGITDMLQTVYPLITSFCGDIMNLIGYFSGGGVRGGGDIPDDSPGFD